MKSETTRLPQRDLQSCTPTTRLAKTAAEAHARFLLIFGCLLLLIQAARADLVLRYSFDETGATNTPAVDSGIPPEADGTFVSSATRTTNSPFAGGNALDLTVNDADNAYVTAGNPIKLNGLTKFTVTFWLNLQADPGQNDRFFSKISGSPTAGFEMLIFQNSDASPTTAANFNPALQVNGLTSRTLYWGAVGHGLNADHQWIFLAVSYDGTSGSSNVKWYEGDQTNAVALVGTASFSAGAVNNTTNDFRVGGTPATTADRTPPCWIDDFRVYNSVLDITNLVDIQQGGGTNSTGGSGPPVFSTEPQSQSLLAGADATFFALVTGESPISYQWFANGLPIPGATNSVYTLSNVVPDYSGSQFSLIVSNSVGVTNSQNATLTVRTIFDSLLTTNLWSLAPGSRNYVTGGYLQRCMAYDPASQDLIIVSRNVGDFIAVIDALTGTEKTYLDTSLVSGGTFDINMVGAADDGAVYVGNLTTSASTTPFQLYRWADDSGSSPVTVAFSGDPGGTTYPGQRWGDNMAVRGSGAGTQILLAPVFSTNSIVSLLQTADGVNFQATPIALTNVPTGFAQVGLAFGPGTNTFYGKSSGGRLYLVQFDLGTQTGFAKQVYNVSAVPSGVTAIGTSPTLKLLAGLDASGATHRLPLYNIADATHDPVIEDQKPLNTVSDNSTFGGLGAVAFGANHVFVLDSNNGLTAFEINTNYPAVAQFSITQFTAPDGSFPTFSWPTEPGHVYQAESKDALADPVWSLVGLPTLASNSTMTVTNVLLPGVGNSNRFYRVRGF